MTSYHYVFKTSSLQTLKKKISRKSFSETIFQSFPFDNLNFCNSMQRCQDSPRCEEDFLSMKKVNGKHGKKRKTGEWLIDSALLSFQFGRHDCCDGGESSLKKAVWDSLDVFCPLITSFFKMKTIFDCQMGGGQMGGLVGVTGCLNSVRDNCTIRTGRPPLFKFISFIILYKYPLEHINTIDVCYAQHWTRKTTTHARFLKVLSLNVIATKNMWAQCAFVWDGVHLIPILIGST